MIIKKSIYKTLVIGALAVSLAACTTTRHGRGAGDGSDMDGSGAGGRVSTYGADGSGSGGFQPATSCNVPQTGKRTEAYYFEYDSSSVHPDDASRLQALAGQAGGSKLRVVGNTDNRGSREYNLALGWRRANAVASALEQAGVAKQKINTNSNGAEKPIAFGASDEDFQCNRRVDVSES